ncbi:hypothetical protein LCGC14_0176300 [marine sediment metagenome]|uniref:Uracil-DNA glycosylase-like domain-containing protein n=1 Tax=marine sediment metagenome TaxID=412755 RepID=A0A0F9X9X0_9ZZZZ
MESELFIEILQNVNSNNLFNPYTDLCELDKPNAPEIRTNNLRIFLDNIDRFDTILVGEAPGHIGARKTGLAFTSNHILKTAEKTWGMKGFEIATKKEYYKELSAHHVWSVLPRLVNPPILWNIIPLHPFKGEQFTNRTPNNLDHLTCNSAVEYFFNNTEFRKIIAIGRVAQKRLRRLGFDVEYVRHVSMGGSNKFKASMYELFEKYDGFEISEFGGKNRLRCIKDPKTCKACYETESMMRRHHLVDHGQESFTILDL